MLTNRPAATRWRASGPYLGTNSSKAGLVEETRRFLLAYRRTGDLTATRQAMLAGELPQRARATRETIVLIIQQRLVRWNPPAWVLADLAAFAADTQLEAIRSALLLHVVRQDTLLYDVVQKLILPRWQEGDPVVVRGDVQRLLDAAHPDHPEIDRWSHTTRAKLAGNLLSILRDYGLLQGTSEKRIVEPGVPDEVAEHLVRLLQAEGVAEGELAQHPDWRLWLWTPQQAQATIDRVLVQEGVR